MSLESILKCINLVRLGQEEMEESNNSTFKFSSLVSSDSDWGETLPEDVFTDVSGNEERNTTAKTISLLE